MAEPSPVLNVREQAAVVETGKQSLNEALFELGQHGWILFPCTRSARCKSHQAAASLHRVRLSGPAGGIALQEWLGALEQVGYPGLVWVARLARVNDRDLAGLRRLH